MTGLLYVVWIHRKQTLAIEKQDDKHNSLYLCSRFVRETRENFLQEQHPSALQTQPHPQTTTGSSQGQNSTTRGMPCSEECLDFYIDCRNQRATPYKRMAQHRRASSTGQDSDLHLQDKSHTFRWFWKSAQIITPPPLCFMVSMTCLVSPVQRTFYQKSCGLLRCGFAYIHTVFFIDRRGF